MRFSLHYSFLTIFLLTFQLAASQKIEVEDPLSDWVSYFSSPDLTNFIAIFGNFLWSLVSPWIGGIVMVQAYSQFQSNPALYKFLGYSVHDLYVLDMQQQKS